MFSKIYFPLVIVVSAYFAFLLGRKAVRERRSMAAEPGNPILLALYSAVLQFFAAFGISDFSISIIVYRKFHLIDDERLPGTLLTACVIPVSVMALGYLAVIQVEQLTLLVCVLSGIIGSVIGTAVVSRLNASAIRLMMAIVLLAAAVMLLMRLTGCLPSGGAANGFTGWKLVLTAAVTCLLSALSMGGFAVTAMMLSFFYSLGLNPIAAFPLAMGTCSIACAFGGIKYVKRGNFGLKLSVISSVFGGLGAFIAVHFVRTLSITVLQWVIAAIILYTACTLFYEFRRDCRRKKPTPSQIQPIIQKSKGEDHDD